MQTKSESDVIVFDPQKLAVKIRAGCLHQGWNYDELARRAGVSRTTLYHLERGRTRQPRYATLNRIAAALELSVESLCDPTAIQGSSLRNSAETHSEHSRLFDRATNKAVSDVRRDSPELFSDWSAEEWDELYSTFGTGGALSAEGVVGAARQMNQKRDVLRQLQVVLETHLADVASHLIETLYGMVHIESNLADSPELAALIARHHSEACRE